jgi:hypothetical protein
MPLVHDHANKRIIVAGLELCLGSPRWKVHPRGVFTLDDNALSVSSDTSNVAAVLGAVAGPAFNAIVVEREPEGGGNDTLEPSTGLAGTATCPSHFGSKSALQATLSNAPSCHHSHL